MAIENFAEVQTYMEANKDNEEVSTYIKGFNNLDGVKNFLATNEDGKKYLNSYADNRVTKGIDSWKTTNLDDLVSAKVKELHPDADPKDLQMAQLQAKIDSMAMDSTKKELTNKAYKIATEKHLPVDLVSYFVGSDEETTISNLTNLEKTFQAQVDLVVAERLKGGYVPKGDTTTPTSTLQTQYMEAIKEGNMAKAVSLKNKIFEEQKK
jgi:antitoxin component of RelBE/YafQ-DinJ toxin-antitoxin module